jgi:hypothetical protein
MDSYELYNCLKITLAAQSLDDPVSPFSYQGDRPKLLYFTSLHEAGHLLNLRCMSAMGVKPKCSL